MAKKQVVYDEKAIKTLDALEHIRLRTGMYIGRLGDGSNPSDGIYVMLKEVIDNSIDEFIMGHGRKIEITRYGSEITVRDFGRGIPLGKVVDCVSKMNTGGKYNDDVFQFSVGLNGIGNKAVNALSSDFEVISYRDGKYKRARFSRGKKKKVEDGKDKKQPNGTMIRFIPDSEIFDEYDWREEYIEHRLRYYAYLNSGLTLHYNGNKFASKAGLADLLDQEIGSEPRVYEVLHCRVDRMEFAFTHTHAYGETYYSFVNGQYTNDGGTHQSAFRPDRRDIHQAPGSRLRVSDQEQARLDRGSDPDRERRSRAGGAVAAQEPRGRRSADRQDQEQRACAQGAVGDQEGGPGARQEGGDQDPQADRLQGPPVGLPRQAAGRDHPVPHRGRLRRGRHDPGARRPHPGHLLTQGQAAQHARSRA
jgi:topoisomerase-4 subunit B